MAATGTPTPNIGLRIPIGTDPASVDDINYNSNLLDTKLGAVGSDSVQDQIDTLNSKFSTVKTHTWTATTNGNGVTAIPQHICKPSKQVLLAVYPGDGAYGYLRTDSVSSDMYGFQVISLVNSTYTRVINTQLNFSIAYIDLT